MNQNKKNQKTALISQIDTFGRDTRVLTCRLPSGESLGFVGGQFLIIDTGIPLTADKSVKRCYSILSPDSSQSEFQIAVKRIDQGPGSNFFMDVKIEAELSFSGPWGKYPSIPENEKDALVIATDTGITAAMGLVQGNHFQKQFKSVKLVWFVASEQYFLPVQFVKSQLGSAFELEVRFGDSGSRTFSVDNRNLPSRAFLYGDGNSIYQMGEDLVRSGLSEESVRIEYFFNKTVK